VATYTEKTVGDWVYARLKDIQKEINDNIQRIFNVDPTLRADMEEVRRLSKKIESAEVATTRLRETVERGYDERMAYVFSVLTLGAGCLAGLSCYCCLLFAVISQAQSRLSAMVSDCLQDFKADASAKRDEIMGSVESVAHLLETRVNKRLTDFDSDARDALDGLQQKMVQKVVQIEKRLADRFDGEFKVVNGRLATVEADASFAKKNIEELRRNMKETTETVRKLSDEVNLTPLMS
jgi:archaellum component FlaC